MAENNNQSGHIDILHPKAMKLNGECLWALKNNYDATLCY